MLCWSLELVQIPQEYSLSEECQKKLKYMLKFLCPLLPGQHVGVRTLLDQTHPLGLNTISVTCCLDLLWLLNKLAHIRYLVYTKLNV